MREVVGAGRLAVAAAMRRVPPIWQVAQLIAAFADRLAT
jgi:hypothetical protein